MQEAFVNTEKSDKGLATITFFHPKHNSLPSDILKQLATAITKAGEDKEVKVIVLKSGGDRTFCAGASFDELVAIDELKTGKEFFMGFARVINACRKCPKFIIGRVQGKAVGGGVGLAAAVDYCMATKFASIKLSELNLGLGPFVVGPAVERKIGLSAFSQVTIHADEFMSAEWAKEKGLYTQVFDSLEELDKEVENLSEYLLSKNPEAQKLLKEVFWQNCQNWDELLESRAELSGKLVLSDYTKKMLKK